MSLQELNSKLKDVQLQLQSTIIAMVEAQDAEDDCMGEGCDGEDDMDDEEEYDDDEEDDEMDDEEE